MAGRAFVVAKEVFHHRNGNIFTMRKWLNDQKQSFLFYVNYNNQHLYFEMNFNHLKLRYTDPFNFLTKRALVNQLNMLVVA